jgi:hypothetical protein
MLRYIQASLVVGRNSSSLLVRRFRPIQAIVRSTTQPQDLLDTLTLQVGTRGLASP